MASRLASTGLVLAGFAELAWMNVNLYPQQWASWVQVEPTTIVAQADGRSTVASAGLVPAASPFEVAVQPSTKTPLEPPQEGEGLDFAQAKLVASIAFTKVGATLPRAKARRQARKVAKELVAMSPRAIEVRGHSDGQGDAEKNMLLSRSRAAAITQLLVAGGVDPQMISIVGVGSSEPALFNARGVARRVNRRVEIRVLERLP